MKQLGVEDRERIRQARLAQGVTFQTEQTDRQDGRILVASGTVSRNRDYWTGKPFRLVPSGMRFDAWSKAGLILWMHNFNLPLGRGSLFLEEGQLWAPDSIDFHRRNLPVATNNWIGDAIGNFDTAIIADLWQEAYLNSVSIHVMFTLDDEANIVELDEEILIPTSEVIEFSLVTIPGDREANREKMLQMGMPAELVECLVCDDGEKQQGGLIRPGKGLSTVSNVLYLPDDGRVAVGTPQLAVQAIPNPEVLAMEQKEQGEEVIEEEVTEAEEAEVTEAADVLVDEAPFVAVELELETEDGEGILDVDTLGFAQILAEDQEALMVLAKAFAANPQVLAVFIQAIQQNATQLFPAQVLESPALVPTKIRFVNNRPPVTASRQQPVAEIAQQSQPVAARQAFVEEAVPPEPVFKPRDPVRRRAVLGLVRTGNI